MIDTLTKIAMFAVITVLAMTVAVGIVLCLMAVLW